MSEYGAGASPFFHSETPAKQDHTEEYQSLYHEAYWKVLKDHPVVWGLYIWNMFDFAVDHRNEGDRPGVNDKGLVTEDRKIKKDAFYFYQANWSKEPMVHITSKRFATRGVDTIAVKVYSNAKSVSINLNGVPLAEKTGENGVFVWENVKLKEGENSVTATASFADGKTLSDQALWVYKPGAPKTVKEMQKR
jgi:beta-galactosidase